MNQEPTNNSVQPTNEQNEHADDLAGAADEDGVEVLEDNLDL